MSESKMPNTIGESEDYYESQSVSAGRSTYCCAYCGGTIAKGSPSIVHKFYPEFTGERVHKKCSENFLNSYRCEYCYELINKDSNDLLIIDGKAYCKECYSENINEVEENDLIEGDEIIEEFEYTED